MRRQRLQDKEEETSGKEEHPSSYQRSDLAILLETSIELIRTAPKQGYVSNMREMELGQTAVIEESHATTVMILSFVKNS